MRPTVIVRVVGWLALGACAAAPPIADLAENETPTPKHKDGGAPPAASSSSPSDEEPPSPSGTNTGPPPAATQPAADGGGGIMPTLDGGPAGGLACPGAKGATTPGPIDVKYRALGGCTSVLGLATSFELIAGDGQGHFNTFEQGVIFWHPNLGAWEVHGKIFERWSQMGRESSSIGYPVGDEQKTPDTVGRYSVFERGSIYWSPSTGAWEVTGRIRDKYKELGWEAGSLGYPSGAEVAVNGGRKSTFQHGTITWLSSSDTFSVTNQ